jgi:hypothetical protein
MALSRFALSASAVRMNVCACRKPHRWRGLDVIKVEWEQRMPRCVQRCRKQATEREYLQGSVSM